MKAYLPGGVSYFFPDAVFKLVREQTALPNQVVFHVPTCFNKLDIKQYLQKLYNVQTTEIQTNIIHKGDNNEKRTYRKALVTLTQDFEWPALPTAEKDSVQLDMQLKFDKAVFAGDLVVAGSSKRVSMRPLNIKKFVKEAQDAHEQAGKKPVDD